MRVTVTPNKELAAEIRAALKENDGYCPCSLIHDEAHKCMCQEFLAQPPGSCHCGLYIKTEM